MATRALGRSGHTLEGCPASASAWMVSGAMGARGGGAVKVAPCHTVCALMDHKRPKTERTCRSTRRAHAACSTSIERLARGLMTGGSYWTAPEAMWNRICVPVALTCGIGRGV